MPDKPYIPPDVWLTGNVRPVTIELPDGVLEMRDRGDDWAAWVDRLPALARDLLDEWELTVDGELMHGYCSLVVPVRHRATASARC